MGKIYLEILESYTPTTLQKLNSFQEKTINQLLQFENLIPHNSTQTEKYFELLLKLKCLYLQSNQYEKPDAQLKLILNQIIKRSHQELQNLSYFQDLVAQIFKDKSQRYEDW
jgi:hypothetical protein